MTIINPEFHRYIWLNFSKFRLIAMPLLLLLVIYLFSSNDVWQAAIFTPAVWCYFIVVFLWGNYEAASASSRDIGENTWDFQRMSAITPWELTIGKLFGSTSFVWYSGLLLLLLIAFSYNYIGQFKMFEETLEVYPTPVKPIIYLVFAGIMGHSTALLTSIGHLKMKGKTSTATPFIFGLIVSCSIASITIGFDFKNHELSEVSQISWHGFSIETHAFVITSLLYFFFWTLVAIQRNLRHELQYRNSPIVMMVFLITFCIYCSGLADNISVDSLLGELKVSIAKLFICFLILLPFTYLTLFMEASNYAKYKRWIYALKAKEVKRAIETTPAWIGVAVMLLPTYIFLNFSVTLLPLEDQSPFGPNTSLFAFTTALLLFTTRDGLILHYILSGTTERHKAFMLFLFYILAYVLLPYTLDAILPTTQYISNIFYPMANASFFQANFPVFVQVVLSFWILKRSLKDA